MGNVSMGFGRTTWVMSKVKRKATIWWLQMTDAEQLSIACRTAVVATSTLMTGLFLPAFAAQYDMQRTEAVLRAEVRALSTAESPVDVLREHRTASVILEHPWLRSVEHSIDRAPRSALTSYAKRDRDGAALSTVIDFRPDQYDIADEITAEHKCLTQAVYYEAGVERTEGKIAVAEVIMNRVADHRYPNSICEVVFQGATRTTGCQFTFTCDGALKRKPNEKLWKQAETVAAHVLLDLHKPRTKAATHYHATYVDPVWNAGLIQTRKIGSHIFYRFPRGSEWRAARAAVAKKRAYRAQVAAYRADQTASSASVGAKGATFTPASLRSETVSSPAP